MDEFIKRAANLTKRLSSVGENNGEKWSEYESMTLELFSKSYLLLQVLSAASPDPGYAPKPLWSQPSWVHISEKDKVSKEVTRADLLSSVGDTVNQNCACTCMAIQLIKLMSLGDWAKGKKKGERIKGGTRSSAHSWFWGSRHNNQLQRSSNCFLLEFLASVKWKK